MRAPTPPRLRCRSATERPPRYWQRSCAGQAGGLNESSTKCPGIPLAEQIRAGNVPSTNQYALLRGSYEYFVSAQSSAYSGHGHLATARPWQT